jgi:hypothetical protein
MKVSISTPGYDPSWGPIDKWCGIDDEVTFTTEWLHFWGTLASDSDTDDYGLFDMVEGDWVVGERAKVHPELAPLAGRRFTDLVVGP